MSRKLLAGAVAAAGVLALTPGVASANCYGRISNCPGYRYQCDPAISNLDVFTNSDATEDSYEAKMYGNMHLYRCYGD